MEDIARKIFAKAKYQATEEDIKRLSNNMTLLKARELGNLNQRLIEGGRGIWDTIAEHNFAVGLCSLQDPTITIRYEPSEGLQRRPDFKIGKGSITYWIQMKKLVPLGRENRQNKIIEQIKRETKDIKIKKFFSCDLSSDFTHSDVSELVKFITNTADSSLEGKDYFFQYDNEQKARIVFWIPRKRILSHLTLSAAGNMDVIEITDISTRQIKQSLCKAVGGFNWRVNQNVINLIVIESDNHNDINICDAIFGTEVEVFRGDRYFWYRKDDGFFQQGSFSKKVAGVIAIRKREKKPICYYYMILYVNDAFKCYVDNIDGLLEFSKVVYRNMRPPSGKGGLWT